MGRSIYNSEEDINLAEFCYQYLGLYKGLSSSRGAWGFDRGRATWEGTGQRKFYSTLIWPELGTVWPSKSPPVLTQAGGTVGIWQRSRIWVLNQCRQRINMFLKKKEIIFTVFVESELWQVSRWGTEELNLNFQGVLGATYSSARVREGNTQCGVANSDGLSASGKIHATQGFCSHISEHDLIFPQEDTCPHLNSKLKSILLYVLISTLPHTSRYLNHLVSLSKHRC